MAIFRSLILPWKGKDYTIPGDQIVQAIAAMEDVITLHELYQFNRRRTPPFAKLARAYALLLQFAGADADENEVFARILSETDAQENAKVIVEYLFSRLLPDAAALSAGGAPRGNRSAGAARSSKNSTKRSSARAS